MIGMVLGVASMATGILGSRKSSRAAKRAGMANARNIQAETAETIRRSKLQNDQLYGSAVAAIGGSGVRGSSGSVNNYLSNMNIEQTRQLDWTQKSGNMRASIALQTGKDTASQIKDQAIGNVFSGLSSMYTGGAFTPPNKTGYITQNPSVGSISADIGGQSKVPDQAWFK